MKDKKQSKSFFIAINYCLSAGLIIPNIFYILISIVISTLINKNNYFPINIVPLAIWVVGAWLGSIYAANYLKKTYIIDNSNKITNFATVYYFFFFLIFHALYQNILFHKIIFTLAGTLMLIGQTVVFYILGKIYIKNNK
ncbi:MAG: hypothetical protein WC682_00965 [Parcubacteria group bacterium]|jgi:hypothetical protein